MKLKFIDMSAVTIAKYVGTNGSWSGWSSDTVYNENTIPARAFYDNKYINSFIFPDSVEEIADEAFYSTSLLSVNFPPKLKKIGYLAFSSDAYLKSAKLPNTVKEISDAAFQSNYKLETINLPDSMTALGVGVFWGCKKLNNTYLPRMLSSVNASIFNMCTLINVTSFPETSASTIIPDAVYRATSVSESTIAIPSNTVEIGQYVFRECSKIKSFTVPANIKTLKNGIFKDCSSLKAVCIPSSITSMRGSMFENDSALVSLKVMSKTPIDLSTVSNDFNYVNKSKCTLYIPVGSKAAYQAASQWKDFTSMVELDSVITKSVNISAGGLSTALTTGEAGLTTKLVLSGNIDARDFKFMRDEMPFLEEIDITAATIQAYDGDSSLLRSTTLAYPSNTIPFNALRGKSGLRILSLPASIIAIGDSAFWGCSQLRLINLKNSSPIDLNISGKTFDYVPRATCVLSVPKDATPSYRSAEVWNSFTSIEETSTALNEVKTLDAIKISVSPIGLVISGLSGEKQLSIYDLKGNLIYNKELGNEQEVLIKDLIKGAYILKIGDQSQKVVL
jgi:hypothetical protein